MEHLVDIIIRIRIFIQKLYVTKRSQRTINSVASVLPAGRSGVRIPVRVRFLEKVNTGCGTHTSSYSLCAGVHSRTKSTDAKC